MKTIGCSGLRGALIALSLILSVGVVTAQEAKKPNILVIMPDDLGLWNVSAYNRGSMGYMTPNIDRIANEGAIFSDQYAQPSCTPGRASFITGMYPIRTGLTTVGMVGAKQGMLPGTPTLAQVLKQQGYATGQFGKNHVGDRNEHLPTVHGFDEFYGFLYHLNVLQEPLDNDYPDSDEFRAKYLPRGIIHSFATDIYDDSVPDKRFGEIGKQTVEDTGLPQRWSDFENMDAAFNEKAFAFMKKAVDADEPFFVWLNPSRMHVFTIPPEEYKEKAKAISSYDDPHSAGAMQLDDEIGVILDKLDEMGIADNTIVVFTTDNGPEHSTYPFGGTTPYRSEKMSTWEGGTRVPMMVRWPNQIPAGQQLNGMQTLMDVFATLTAAAGVDYDDLKDRLAKGDDLGTGAEMKAHLDGNNNLDYWTGKTDASATDTFIYWAESSPQAIRKGPWKWHFAERDGYYGVTTHLEIPRVYNIRQDPFESYDQYPRTLGQLPQHKSWFFNVILAEMTEHLQTLKDFPPMQAGSSLSIDKIVEGMIANHPSAN